MPFFCVAVPDISQDDALRIEKGVLGETEGNMVFSLVFYIFGVIPIKLGTFHGLKLTPLNEDSNIYVWLFLCISSIPQRCV
jgi:hypothetical protein